MKDLEKTLYTLSVDKKKVEIPACNRNKDFSRANQESMSGLDLPFQIMTAIYKLNMAGQPAYFERLARMFNMSEDRDQLNRFKSALRALRGWFYVERGGTEYFVDRAYVQTARVLYENVVMPREKPGEKIQYVPGLLIEQ